LEQTIMTVLRSTAVFRIAPLLARGAVTLAFLFGLASAALAQAESALTQKSTHAAEILSQAQSSGFARIIVMYEAPPEHNTLSTAAEDIPAIAAANTAAQNSIIADHFGGPAIAAADVPERGLTRMIITPAFAIDATAAEINSLANDRRVTTIGLDRLGSPQLIQSLPLIGMEKTDETDPIERAYELGATGAGQTIAVLDTGFEITHKFLEGQIIKEACFSTNRPRGHSTSLCPRQETRVIDEEGAAANCNLFQCEHGTQVAGIAAGLNTEFEDQQPHNGVAKFSSLIVIKMYSKISDIAVCGIGMTPCTRYFDSDLAGALEFLYINRKTEPVAAINFSGGWGRYSAPCDNNPDLQSIKQNVDNLRAAGIPFIAMAGNSGARNAIADPACLSSAIAVASSDKKDAISDTADISAQVALLAPGVAILTSLPAGFPCSDYSGPKPSSGGSYCPVSGASIAAPHVAGAFAAIRSACPDDYTVGDILNALIDTGWPIKDNRQGGTITKPRIQVDAAVRSLGCRPKVLEEPTSTVIIKNASGTNRDPRNCLTFGPDGTLLNPVRYNWGKNNELCGFPGGRSALLAKKLGVWQLVQQERDLFILKIAAINGDSQCLRFDDYGRSRYPDRTALFETEFCGFKTRQELLRNKQAVWRLTQLQGDKFMLRNNSQPSDYRYECLIFSGNGDERSPSRYDWKQDTRFCGSPNGKKGLFENNQAVFQIIRLSN
jgi:subtilisin family serine protease